jgi:phenylalanyl-tRNA synthetase beta chain
LNNEEYKFSEQNLLIADAIEPIAIAGVIGGLTSSVDENTKTIVFESAIFNPASVRKTAKALTLSTDSSYRFERGVSSEIKNFAMKRAVDILLSVCPDAKLLQTMDFNTQDFEKRIINLSLEKINKIIGKKYTQEEVLFVFKKLNFDVKYDGDFFITVPSHRNDIIDSIDLIEEVARIDGYKNIEPKPIFISPFLEHKKLDKLAKANDFKQYFVGLGFFEAINYSFVSKAKVEFFGENLNDCFRIVNPLSETEEIMTPSRILRLIDNAVFSFKRSEELIKLFEIGKCFHKKTNSPDELEQNENFVLSGVLIGNQDDVSWNNDTKKVDFFYTKGILQSFFEKVGVKNYSFKQTETDFLDKNNSADIFLDDKKIGFVGKLSKKSEKFFDIKSEVFVFETNIDDFFSLENKKSFKALSCFPIVTRDLSLIVNKGIKYEHINSELVKLCGNLLKDIKIFDVYEGEPIAKDFKNISVRLYLQSEQETLSDEKINILQTKILAELDDKLAIKLRP